MLCFCLYCSNVPPHISHTMCCQCANVSYSTPLPHHSLESGYLPPPPPPPVSLDWSHGWLAWMAVSPEWKYCRARGRHHLRTMRTDIWFTKMAMCCKIDVRELFIFYKKLFFIFFIIVFFFYLSKQVFNLTYYSSLLEYIILISQYSPTRYMLSYHLWWFTSLFCSGYKNKMGNDLQGRGQYTKFEIGC